MNYTMTKASLGAESAEGLATLQKQLNAIGYEISTERGRL